MTKDEMLKVLAALSYPITHGLIVSDDGCEFCILTNQKGYNYVVGGAFPVNGPLRLSAAEHSEFFRVMSLKGIESLKVAIDTRVDNEIIKESLLNLVFRAGEHAMTEVFQANLRPGKSFYVFHNMGSGESAMFSTLKSAYQYFLDYFLDINEGVPWSSLDEGDLIEWVERVKEWQEDGSRKLPPRGWLGASYSPC